MTKVFIERPRIHLCHKVTQPVSHSSLVKISLLQTPFLIIRNGALSQKIVYLASQRASKLNYWLKKYCNYAQLVEKTY